MALEPDSGTFLLLLSEGSDGVIPPAPVLFTDTNSNIFSDDLGNFFKEG